MENRLAPELALRIGLAGRCLQGTGLRAFIDALLAALGHPLSADKFAGLDVPGLRLAGGGVLAGETRGDLRRALAYLRGDAAIEILPAPATLPAASPPDALRLAVATDDGHSIDGNFGNCRNFLIYQVSASDIRLVDHRAPPSISRRGGRDKLRTGLIGDCRLLYAHSLSNRAAAQLTVCGIHPVTFPEAGSANEKLAALQRVLASRNPPPWLAKAIGRSTPPRLAVNRPTLIHSR